jgi:putative sporulation protein YyaC
MRESKWERTVQVDEQGLKTFVRSIAASHPIEEMRFLCIGTDRSSGDCLGPWVGTLLSEAGFSNVIGTLEHPCDAHRLLDVLPELSSESQVLAIDACLGRPESVGTYLVARKPLIPARSVGKDFPPVGSCSIAGIVNASGPKPYWSLQTTSVHLVMKMARSIADAIISGWGPPQCQHEKAGGTSYV